MAIICRDYKLLFIMVPATGCTSVGKVLRDKFGGEWIPQKSIYQNNQKVVDPKHSNLHQLLEYNLISQKELDSFLKFATVRNPFDRYVTKYVRLSGTWLEQRMEDQELDSQFTRCNEVEREILIGKKKKEIEQARNLGFEQWLSETIRHQTSNKSFKRRVKDWIKSSIDESYMPNIGAAYPMIKSVDGIIRYEHLESDFNFLLRKRGVIGVEKFISIPHTNKTTGKKPYQEYYTPEARKLVEKVFAKELAMFDYTFD